MLGAPTTIYLIRHAQSQPSVSAHHLEWPLSDLGRSQSAILAPLLLEPQIEKVFSSPYLRCLETIRPFLEMTELPFAVDDDLREKLIANHLTDGFKEIWKRSWDDFGFALPGCEDSQSAQKRFGAAVSKIAVQHPGRTLGISSHGNVMGLFLNHIDDGFRREEAEALRNPDVIRVVAERGVFHWDREFCLGGLDAIATSHSATPFPKRAR